MKSKRLAIAGLVLLALAGTVTSQESKTTSSPAPSATTAASAAAASTNKTSPREQYAVIGYLETRDRVIAIKSGPRGPVYSVASKEGKVLLENLTIEQLRARAPEVHDFIESAVASPTQRKGNATQRKGDATLRKLDGRL